MFSGFFYVLRAQGVPVSLYEWLTLMQALSQGLADNSLTGFYYLARSVLIKSEAHFDKYDAAFASYFSYAADEKAKPEAPVLKKEERAFNPDFFNPERYAKKEELPPADITVDFSAFVDQLEVKAAPRPDKKAGTIEQAASGGGSKLGAEAIGAGGVRFGGEGGGMTAVKIAGQRRYKDYQDDNIRNIRQFEIALRALRQLSTKLEGPKDELNLEATIEETGKSAGMLSLVWDRPRKNSLKLIVLMDSMGSIYSYHEACKKLFNAAHRSSHFKEIKFFYFHNCIYGRIYKHQYLDIFESISTEEFFRRYHSEYRLLIVGDAKMAPSELTHVGGIIDWSAEYNAQTGMTWLRRLARQYPYAAWLNPVPERLWGLAPRYETIKMVEDVFPMFELTPSGIEKAVKRLRSKSR